MDSEFIRLEAIRTLDLRWARELAAEECMWRGIPLPTDEVLLISLHKSRVVMFEMPEALRRESMAWLKARGYEPGAGLGWPADGSLP